MKWPSQAAITASLFVGAVVASLFFHGFQVDYLSLTQAALIVWAVVALWNAHDRLILPKTPLAICLAVYWLWLASSLLWTQAPAIGVLNFWWMGSLPLVFWLYMTTRERDAMWQIGAVAIVGLGLVLALYAAYQLRVLHEQPRSVFINLNSHAALMNLLLFPVIGYFALSVARGARAVPVFALGACVFVLTYALAITRGRGAMLAFAISLVVFAWVARAHVARKVLVAIGLLLTSAFVVAGLTSHDAVFGRLDTLSNPTSAGATRLVIWQQAWAIIQEQPWWGRGLGTFSLVYPPYRLPSDSSAGAFVHNDYLQIWIELGLPGLMSFSAIWVATAAMFWRTRAIALTGAMRVELAALLSGVLATALHSVVDFNFYQIPILLIVGLILGRAHALVTSAQSPQSWVLRPATIVRLSVFRVILVLLAAIPLTYFGALASAAYTYKRALTLAEQGDLEQADRAFARAMRLAPVGDNVAISRADLYRHVLRTAHALPHARREQLYADALSLLAHAQRQNPLPPLAYILRGTLIAENPSFAGDEWRAQATANYRQALQLDPRSHAARVAYAELLLKGGDAPAARAILEDGLHYWYLDYEAMVPYYSLTARLRREAGDVAGAEALEARIKRAMENSGWRWVPRADAGPATGSNYTPLLVK